MVIIPENMVVSSNHPSSRDLAHHRRDREGPLFLLPGIVIAMYVTKTPIPEEWRIEISRYLQNIQRHGGLKDDGWGMFVLLPLLPLYIVDIMVMFQSHRVKIECVWDSVKLHSSKAIRR